jgi:phospholipase C
MRSGYRFRLLVSLLALTISTLVLTGCQGLAPQPKTPPATTYQLTVTAPPSGAGTVASAPAGISCPGTCTATFASGTKVTLTATASGSYTFAGWSGACSGTSTCNVTMTANESVTPTFKAGYGVAVTINGNGSGTVTSTPAGISCPTTCSATFPQNTAITLTATPQTGDYFGGWSGGGCSGTGTCSLTLSASANVTASFTTSDALTVTMTGSGVGNVTSSPTGINCTSGSTTGCSANFAPNTPVTLTETATAPNTFSGWSGACTGTGACVVTLTAATSVTASFAPGGTLQSLNHIIFFAQENRSFDHYFGYMRQYWANQGIPDQSFDGLPQFNPTTGQAPLQGPIPTVPGCDPAYPFIPGDPANNVPAQNTACIIDTNSPAIPSFHSQSVCTEEISPFWNEARDDWNVNFLYPSTINPLMNGFVKAAGDDARQYSWSYNDDSYVNDTNGYRGMEYFTDQDLNFYYYMASTFATSDRWFAPILSRTQLNRAYIIAGTSQGYAYPPGSNSNDDAAFSAQTIFEELQNSGKGITWRVYVDPNSTDPTDGTNCAAVTGAAQNKCLADVSYLNEFTYEQTIQADPSLYQNFVPTTQFASDLQNDSTFPQVVMIEPPSDAGLDEHPSDKDAYPENIQQGAQFVEGLVKSFMYSPTWKDSAMIFTYDEGGGFYDHVAAQPAPAPDQYTYPIDLEATDKCDGADQSTGICSFAMTGYRIPLIVISPFAKANFVSHTVRDTTAWLNLVEERFSVPALTARDAYWSTTTPVATMDEFFDFVNVPFATPPAESSIPTQSTNGTCSMAAPTP